MYFDPDGLKWNYPEAPKVVERDELTEIDPPFPIFAYIAIALALVIVCFINILERVTRRPSKHLADEPGVRGIARNRQVARP